MTDAEISVLVDEVVNNSETLFGKLNNSLTNRDKNIIWSSIAHKMKAVGPIDEPLRLVDKIQKKFWDMKSNLKGKLVERKKWTEKTGNPPLPESLKLKPFEERLQMIFGII